MEYRKLKTQILELRQKGLTYNQIQKELSCSKGTIAYHCQKIKNNSDIINNNRREIYESLNEINSWDNQIKNKILYLYNYGICLTEIADVLESSYLAIKGFCKNLPKSDYSSLSNYEKVKRRRKKLKLLAVIHKGSKCERCGYNNCLEVMEFHHIDPNKKEFTIAQRCNTSWKKIKKELQKCNIYCANCHREIHNNTMKDGWQ